MVPLISFCKKGTPDKNLCLRLYTITVKPITASLFRIKFSSSSHCRFNTFHRGKSTSRFGFT
ncbi:hypothetical protein CLOLEP_03969 [[Clostridium] leptum DSM 753]|uniref:Uncharacterized protein n=1 Tax=[Clostridium] leptum DSM 753 TaxID=428125 RepID=A7VZE0_9FIRM|nr:hypothetical protein CLOLEP_03969 [[Clostridium] leptum DSM 753]